MENLSSTSVFISFIMKINKVDCEFRFDHMIKFPVLDESSIKEKTCQ